jgi:hypothetical protein
MNDHEVLDQVRDGLAGLHMSTSADQIVARARTRRHRQQLTAASAAAVAAATGTALGLSLTGTTAPPAPPARPGHQPTELTAFTLQSGPHGTSVLTMRKGDRLDPAALRGDLARHGIPALVTVGKMCNAAGAPGDLNLNRVVTSRRTATGGVQLTINPAAIPAGTRLSIGYFPGGTGFALISDASHLTCTTGRPDGTQPATRVGGAPKPGQPATRAGGRPKAGQPTT